MRIKNSLVAMFMQRIYNEHNNVMHRTTGRISSGNRIISAADDAAGLAISEKVRARIRSMKAAMRVSEDGVSLIQTAESALASVQAVLQRLRELAVQAASDTNDKTDRNALDREYQQLMNELNDITRVMRFNDKLLFSGVESNPLSFNLQTGPDGGDIYVLTLSTVTPEALGIVGTHVRTRENAEAAIPGLSGAIDEVSMNRAALGAAQARLYSRISSMEITAEALEMADSRIRDADIAEEMVRLTQARMLARVTTAMMVQANVLANNVLYLLSRQPVTANSASDSGANSAAARADGDADSGGRAAAPSGSAKTPEAQPAVKPQAVRGDES